jgi:radical SAM superfamily enzyme YgiQ (UPF0313 family)
MHLGTPLKLDAKPTADAAALDVDGGALDADRAPAERPHVLDLDALPSPAFDLFYDADPRYRKEPNKSFLATRGCPYRCSYCFNRQLNQRYREYGALLRSRDPEALCDEILAVRTVGGSSWCGSSTPTSSRTYRS